MRQLMDESAEFFGLRLTGQECDSAAVAHAQRGRNALAKGKLDALLLHECEKAFTVLAYVAADLAYSGKLCAIGLADIEHIGISESGQHGPARCVLVSFVLLSALGDDGSKDADAVLALLHVAA